MRKSGNLSKFWMVSFSRRMVWDTNLFKLNQYLSNWIISLNLKPTPRLLWQGNIFDGNYRYSTWLYIAPPQVLLLNSRSSWFFTNLCRMCAQSCLSRLYRQKTNLYSSKRTYQWEITFSNRKYSYTSSFMVVFHYYVCLPSVESTGSSVFLPKFGSNRTLSPTWEGFSNPWGTSKH